jgi:DNA transformation protein and related proteins
MPDNSFKDFVLDQLSELPGVRARAMFGGHGIYQGDRFFGILLGGKLYFKTDEHSRAEFEKRSMQPFIYEKARQTISIHYFEVPAEVLEDRNELVRWAQQAVAATQKEPRPLSSREKRPSGRR